ncbi:hypothetical protein RvY_13510 [Ramazzottius varieornatus]|uniref:Medium-chain acyl-CoA ligase ACSF2, mitochondrial n=1 Tax=Ramazzottius varieornatus TaxID=947166 RepID=A0A1D1VPY5_RAMVA|nr:hypothetical protein RvY_13510 [Ramazzottius varieornatus]
MRNRLLQPLETRLGGSKRCLSLHIPKIYPSRPATKLKESYIHCASDIPFLSTTCGKLLDYRADTTGDTIGYVFSHQNLRKTYGELRKDANKLAHGLLSLGLQPGDRIGIWGPNSYEWIVSMFAAAKAGLILVSVNPAYKVHELEYCLNKVQMKAIVAAEGVGRLRYYPYFQQLFPDLDKSSNRNLSSKRVPHLKHVIMLTKTSESFPGTLAMDEVVNTASKEDRQRMEGIAKVVQPDDPFNIQFTSGTTGSPKGATLSHFNMINCAYFSGLRVGLGFHINSYLCPLPLYHVYACVGNLLTCTVLGKKVVFPSERFEAEAALKAIQDEQTEYINGIPMMFGEILNHPNFDQYDVSSIKGAGLGGSPCPPVLIRECIKKFNTPKIGCGYGQTECSLSSFASFADDSPHDLIETDGYPMHHTEAKLVDGQGNIVPLGTVGEIWTRNYGTMLGYWDEEEKTKEVRRSDRWLISGDLGVLSENGSLKIVGRVKDMIIRGGENVYPVEIENVLLTHPKVASVAVCGVPDRRMGEEICAWIRLKDQADGKTEDDTTKAETVERELKTFCLDKLAKYKTPKLFVFYKSPAEIPMTVTGKVQKHKLTDMSVERLQLERFDRAQSAST